MVVRGLYLKDFEPIVQPGEYIQLYPSLKQYVVGIVYPLPLLEIDLCDGDHLNANVTVVESAEDELDDVYLDDGWIGHFRIIPRDDFAITYIAKPKARPMMITRNKSWQIQGILDDARTNPANEHLQLNELFQFEDTEFWYKATANAGILATARLEVFGYVLKVDESAVPRGVKPTLIPTEGGYPQ